MKVFIETVRGSTVRTRYDEATFVKKESFDIRYRYPYDYGFIIGTNKKSEDCIDCYVITEERLAAGQAVECEPIGMMEMFENGEVDHKVLAVYRQADVRDVDEIVRSIRQFIESVFRDLPGERIELGKLLSREQATSFITENS